MEGEGQGEMEREREGRREGGKEGGREGGRERERGRERLSTLYIIVMIFFSTAGGYFVAVHGRLSPDKLLLNN